MNAVEAALLLSGKKFAPFLPRELRVSRCKAPYKTARAASRKNKIVLSTNDNRGKRFRSRSPAEHALGGRAAKLLGRAATSRDRRHAVHVEQRRRESDASIPGLETSRGPGFESAKPTAFEGRRASTSDNKSKITKKRVDDKRKDAGLSSNNSKRRLQRVAKWRGKKPAPVAK